MADKRAVHAYLSEDAHQGWQTLSEEEGVSVTGLLQTIGTQLQEGETEFTVEGLVTAGRKVDSVRRRRGDK